MPHAIKDGYYFVGEPEYIGQFPIRQELELYPDGIHPEVKGWTINKVVSINGNKYIRLLNKFLKKTGRSSEDDLSAEEIEKLLSKCEI